MTARNARLALVVRQPKSTAPPPSATAPAVPSNDRFAQPAFSTVAVGTQARRVLRACLNELPERYRTTLWLSDVEQQSIQNVAAALAIPVPLASARVERARHMLAKALCRLGA
jgi:DNA-directed RNA polymerase specialized sigma24 family protein